MRRKPHDDAEQGRLLLAGVGSIERSLESRGAKINVLVEIDPIKRRELARRFPEAKIYDDVRSDEWTDINYPAGGAADTLRRGRRRAERDLSTRSRHIRVQLGFV